MLGENSLRLVLNPNRPLNNPDITSLFIKQVIKSDNPTCLEKLINDEENINESDSNGDNALIHAIASQHSSSAIWLIEHNIDINHINNFGETALHYAVTGKLYNIVKILLKKGAKPDIYSINNRTALGASILNADQQMHDLLFAHTNYLFIAKKYGDCAKLLNILDDDILKFIVEEKLIGDIYNEKFFIDVKFKLLEIKELILYNRSHCFLNV